MKPIDQTGFGMGEGNCLAAAVASIIESDDLAALTADIGMGSSDESEHWWDRFERAMQARGYRIGYLPMPCEAPQGYSIMSGMSPRGLLHATVALDGKLAHDPHPSRAGIIGEPRDFITIEALR